MFKIHPQPALKKFFQIKMSTLLELLDIASAVYNPHGNRIPDHISPLVEENIYKVNCILDFISANFTHGLCCAMFQDQGVRIWGIWKKLDGHAGHFVSALGIEYKRKLCDWLITPTSEPGFYEGKQPILKRDIIPPVPQAPVVRGKGTVRRSAQLYSLYYGEQKVPEVPQGKPGQIRSGKQISLIYSGEKK